MVRRVETVVIQLRLRLVLRLQELGRGLHLVRLGGAVSRQTRDLLAPLHFGQALGIALPAYAAPLPQHVQLLVPERPVLVLGAPQHRRLAGQLFVALPLALPIIGRLRNQHELLADLGRSRRDILLARPGRGQGGQAFSLAGAARVHACRALAGRHPGLARRDVGRVLQDIVDRYEAGARARRAGEGSVRPSVGGRPFAGISDLAGPASAGSSLLRSPPVRGGCSIRRTRTAGPRFEDAMSDGGNGHCCIAVSF